ncbi:MAG TPA: ABC transporter permease [Bryobacteraceae bacterium]|nr:ABC transporter permease [Bryobacteraceae bacterium]
MLQDLRLALRRLGKTPGFTAVTIVTLALAIGANTTTFSALNRFLLRPLPVDRPKELFNVGTASLTQSYPDYVDLRERNRTLSGLVAYRIAPVALSQGGKNSHLWGDEATGNYFELLGVHAFLGRTFTQEDDQRSSPHAVIVLSYAAWQDRFGGDPNIVGKSAKLNGLDYNIIGVAPKGFFGTEILLSPEFWVPMSLEPQIEPGNNPWLDRRTTHNIWTLGRLKPGVSERQAEADLNAIAADLARAHREDEGMRVQLAPPGLFGSFLRGPVLGFASVLVAVAGLVLLIACVNIAGMLLARSAERRREVSICLAIGASRGKLIRQLLTESLLLSLAGGAAGVLVALWILKALAGIRLPIDLPGTTELPFDSSVFLFSLLTCVLTTLLFGLAPALQAVRIDLVPALKNQVSEKFRRVQMKDLLVGAQVMLSVILLVGTVLVVRSLQRALTIDVGFNPRHAVAVMFDLGMNGYDEERGRAFERRLTDQLTNLPGVDSFALVNNLPLGLAQSNNTVYAEGKPIPKFYDAPLAHYYVVGPGYFRTMQTRLISGRDIDRHDTADSTRVAVVNEAFAKRLFPGENALGKRFRTNPERTEWTQIVGIAQDGKYQSLNDVSDPAYFAARSQRYDSTIAIVARSSQPPDQLVRRIQQVVTTLDPTLPFFQADSLEDHMRLPLMPARIAATMLGAFGVLAIVLAATGVYGMLAYAISRRTREIGIRVAIGARRGNIVQLVLRRAALIVLSASVAGAALAVTLGRFFTPILYGVSPKDPATYALALALMAVIALIACLVPTRRALRIDPAIALRDE